MYVVYNLFFMRLQVTIKTQFGSIEISLNERDVWDYFMANIYERSAPDDNSVTVTAAAANLSASFKLNLTVL